MQLNNNSLLPKSENILPLEMNEFILVGEFNQTYLFMRGNSANKSYPLIILTNAEVFESTAANSDFRLVRFLPISEFK